MKIKNRILSFTAPIVLGLVLACTGCGSNTVDLSKAPAQTGGPEQGMWQNKQGTTLSMNSGKFEYRKGNTTVTGTYSVSGNNITLAGDGGDNFAATFQQGGPVTIEGQQLVQTD